MTTTLRVDVKGLREVAEFFQRLPEVSDQAQTLAVNDGIRYARRESIQDILEEVAFPASYLKDEAAPNPKMRIVKFARRGDPSAMIRAQDRATSLARFAKDRVVNRGKKPVKVKVNASGSYSVVRKGFFMKLRPGNKAVTEDQYNLGLAIRLGKGETVKGKHKMIQYSKKDLGLYLLYGPSVAQVFRDVSTEIAPRVGDFVAREFIRQFERLSNGR